MIRIRDAFVLANTKLRVHRIRTGITIGVVSILFGFIFASVFITQGILESIERFSTEGLASRHIVTVMKTGNYMMDMHSRASDESLVAEVKRAHTELISRKTAAAKKYGITYEPKIEDPYPVVKDQETGKERISDSAFDKPFVKKIVDQMNANEEEPLDINAFLSSFKSAKLIKDYKRVEPTDGTFTPIEKGKESGFSGENQAMNQFGFGANQPPTVQILGDSILEPFILTESVVGEGELPGVVSFGYAEKLLGLEKLTKDSSPEQKLSRIKEVRSRLNEVKATFCYRNEASLNLLGQARAQKIEIDDNKSNKDYVTPKLQYALPPEGECGAVSIAKDTRTADEKRAAENHLAYQKEIGEFQGEPKQNKVVMRAIGLSGDSPASGMPSAATEVVVQLLSSWLYFGDSWSLPVGLLNAAPAELRPPELFAMDGTGNAGTKHEFFTSDEYLVEFADGNEARAAMRTSIDSLDDLNSNLNPITVMPFGSATLVVDDFKKWFSVVLLYGLGIVGAIAMIILVGLIGRMVSDGRRESAIFRAIGAKRSDIAGIYGLYAFLLSLRMALVSVIIGLALAVAVDMWLSREATVSAQLAYASVDESKAFHFIGIGSWYIPAMLTAIIATGLLASIIPIIMGARRSPINDIRDDR